jgi:hypothetical protein
LKVSAARTEQDTMQNLEIETTTWSLINYKKLGKWEHRGKEIA